MSKKAIDLKNERILKEVDERIKLNKRIEMACRDICLHNGIDPDRFICQMMPEYIETPIRAFYLPNPQFTFPAWWMFRDTVKQALNILEATKC